MRPLLAFLFILALPASAQPSPVVANAPVAGDAVARSGGEPVPDTTDWRRYFPLEVGNEWQYEVNGFPVYGYEIIGDTLVEGEAYFIVRTCYNREPILCTGTDSTSSHALVRYDTTHALVVQRIEIQGEPRVEWWDAVPCRLDTDFGVGPVACTGPGAEGWEYFVSGGYGYTYVLEPDTLHNATFKQFDSIAIITGAVSGIGVVRTVDTKNTGDVARLVFARVGGEEYGEPAFPTPMAPPPAASPLAPAIAALYPNPVRERLTLVLRVVSPGPVVVEVVDVLGRVVRRAEAGVDGPGVSTQEVVVAGLPSGAYFARAQMGSAVVARPFVVTR